MIADADAATWEVARRDRLGKLHDVRRHTPVLEGEPLPGPAESRDDLVGGEEHIVPVADLADAREVVIGRDDDTADPDHWLGEKHGDGVGAFAQDGLFERGRRQSGNVNEAGDARLEERPVSGDPRRAHGGQRGAVVAELSRDDLRLAGPAARFQYERAILMAVSFASAPPDVKKKRLISG